LYVPHLACQANRQQGHARPLQSEVGTPYCGTQIRLSSS
jgi:hypothetical protein